LLQELQVVLTVVAGMTNKEAAAQLFLSTKTIEAHLHRTYRKLGIGSRHELAPLLADKQLFAHTH
jgi:DNA-binding CsgD family transcriptional regulator